MKALEGIKVLDFSHALAGPLCTYHLALLGADVVKVERPRVGDDLRHYTVHAGLNDMSAPFVAANGGKRSIALDLKSDEGREAVRRLAMHADVVVENFRPGVPAKLGIDYASIRALNPAVIYCSITGFGANGQLKDWAAYDHIVQAMSGIMWLNGEPDQGPLKVGLPFSDTFSGYLAAFAIMTSLFKRQRTGQGQQIDVGMLDATLVLLAQGIATYEIGGTAPIRTGNRGYRMVATADTYRTNDGYLSIGANHQHQFEAMCRVLGQSGLLTDPRFSTATARAEHNDMLRSLLESYFLTQSAAELEQRLAAVGVPVAKVRDIPEIVGHPHVKERDLFVNTRVPGLDRPLHLAGSGFRLDEETPSHEVAVPTIGQHTEEILREIGLR
jgi:crotonobetainyl-CoA:carnitine CoA-transferase CaiB-like acyl-CoA transferase